ncbi:MAG: type IV toxin-antitoxin system AbiEi family antitoxin domain-containing protein [Streptosporangiaceae bacterium]
MTYTELAEAGFSGKSIHALASRGVLLRVRRGAYARADLAHHVHGSVQFRERTLAIAAAVAVTGPDAAASHHDAALLHGIDLLDRLPPESISVSRPGGHDRLLAGSPSVRVRPTSLPPGHVTARRGVPVTSAARTVVDMARTTSFLQGVVVADSALYRGKTTRVELAGVIDACGHWPGIEKARRVFGFSTDLAESAFESIARVTFDEHGLPPPELQVWVGEDRPIARVDFLWSQHRTIAEADGALKYADPDRARQQLYRDAELRDAGFEVVHFSWRELTVNPAQVIGWIIAAFARASTVRTAG